MGLEEAKAKLADLRSRFDNPFDQSDKDMIALLYFEVLGKTFKPTSCQQCYHDAVIEMYLYIRKNNQMKKKCNYSLLAGFIIRCPEFHDGAIFTNENLTDEIAAEYLEKYPQMASYFGKIPQKTENNAVSASKSDGDSKLPTKKKKARSAQK